MKTGFLPKFLVALLAIYVSLFASVGRITALSGDVSIVRGAKTQKATPNFQLDEKDAIKSAAGATAQVIFNDKTVITVGSNTLFKVEEYAFDDKNAKARFSVGEGTFKSITGRIGKIAPDKFKVETKTATIGIRGTIFVGHVTNTGALTVACTRGAISVTPNVPLAPPVIVNQGQMTRASNQGVEPPKAYTPADMKNLEKSLTTDKQAQGGSGGGTQQASSQQQAPTAETEAPQLAATTPPATREAAPTAVANSIANVVGGAASQRIADAVPVTPVVTSPTPPAPQTPQTPPAPPTPTVVIPTTPPDIVLPQGYLSGYYLSHKYDYNTYTEDISTGYNAGILTGDTATWLTAKSTRSSIDYGPWSSAISSEESMSYMISPYEPSDTYDGYPIVTNTASSSTIMDNKLETFAFLTVESDELNPGLVKTSYNFVGKPTMPTDFSSLVGQIYWYQPPSQIGDFSGAVGDGAIVRYYADKGSVFNVIDTGEGFKITVGTIVPSPYGSYFSGANIDLPFAFAGTSQTMIGGLYGSEGQALVAQVLDSDPAKTSFKLAYKDPYTYMDTPASVGVVSIEGYGASANGSFGGITDAHVLSGTIDTANGLVQATLGGRSFGSTSDITKSVYIANDMLAATNGSNAIMFSAPDSSYATSDYVSWGYWAVLDSDPAAAIHPLSTWVAGVPTPIGSMPVGITESYDGRVIGGIKTMGGLLQIDPYSGNYVHFDVNFGTANPISGTMQFQSVGGASLWNVNIPATPITGNSFSQTTGITGTENSSSVTGGQIQGKFYGPSANAVGGSFSVNSASDNMAFGVFKANKNIQLP